MRTGLVAALVGTAAISLAQGPPHRRDGKFDLSELPPLLAKAAKVSKTAKYSGERIVEFTARGERRQHREFVLRNGTQTRIEFPEDSPFRGQVIVENAIERRQYFPDRNEIRILPPRGDETVRSLVGFVIRGRDMGINIQEAAGGDVAGMATRLVSFIDRDGNVMQRIWVEPRTGVMLKREFLDRVGTRKGGFEFVRVNFQPVIKNSDFVINRRGAIVITPIDEARRLSNELGYSFRQVPPNLGFRLEGSRVLRRVNPPIIVHVYVGKEGRFALHQSRGPLDAQRLSDMMFGKANVHVWSERGETFALVGDLPKARLEALAAQLRDS